MNSGQCESSSESARQCPKGPPGVPSFLTWNMSGKEALLTRLSFFSKGADVVLLCALCLSLFLYPSAGLHLLAPQGSGLCTPHPNLARLDVGMWGLKLGSLGRTLALVPLALWTVEPCCLRDKYSDSLSIPRRGCYTQVSHGRAEDPTPQDIGQDLGIPWGSWGLGAGNGHLCLSCSAL